MEAVHVKPACHDLSGYSASDHMAIRIPHPQPTLSCATEQWDSIKCWCSRCRICLNITNKLSHKSLLLTAVNQLSVIDNSDGEAVLSSGFYVQPGKTHDVTESCLCSPIQPRIANVWCQCFSLLKRVPQGHILGLETGLTPWHCSGSSCSSGRPWMGSTGESIEMPAWMAMGTTCNSPHSPELSYTR
jgi:hypothetical protein